MVRPPSGYLDPRSFVSQGSERAELSRTTRLGSQVASGGSPRPLRKEAGSMRRTVPRRPWAHGALVAIAALALIQMGAGPGKKKGKGAASQGPGDRRRSLVRGQPGRDEGRGSRSRRRAGQHGGRPAAVVVSQATGRRDEQGRRREGREAAGQSAGLDGDRAADDPDRSQPQGPARRPGRSSAGLRHHEPGRRLPADDPAARSDARRRLSQGAAPRWHWPRGR